MRWEDQRRSDNVEDRRGQSPNYAAAGAAPIFLRFLPGLLRSKTGRWLLIGGVVLIFGGRLVGVDVLGLLFGGAGTGSAPDGPKA